MRACLSRRAKQTQAECPPHPHGAHPAVPERAYPALAASFVLRRTCVRARPFDPLLPHARPQGNKRSAQEVEQMIREKTQAMERESLSMKEEKAALAGMKRMKDDNRKMLEWEAEMEELRNKRAHLTESLRQTYEEVDRLRNEIWYDEVAAKLGLVKEDLNEVRLPISDGMQELLGSPLWKKRLQTEFRVLYKMDRGASKAVRLAGALSSVEAALKLISEYGPVDVRTLRVDEEQQGLLIGRKGETIAKLHEETGCSLDLRKGAKQLLIAGPPELVAAAEARVTEMLETQRRIELVVKFDPEQKGMLLGKGGSTINRIQQESRGATIELGKGGDSSVKLVGPNEAVLRARSAIAELLHLDAAMVKKLEVPAEIVDAVVGRGGEHVRQLEA